MLDIIQICLKEALIIIPIVVGIGILYTYLKIIDISVDGVVILCGIVAAYIWNITGSYLLSILSSCLCGIICSFLISLSITKLHISPIVSGLIFTLIIFPISVILIGESLSVKNSNLLRGYKEISLWLIILIGIIFTAYKILFRSKIGLEIKSIGSSISVSGNSSKTVLTILIYSFVGLLYGISSALYVHNTGSARSGSGFELLVLGLCSFVVVEKLLNSFKSGLFKFRFFSNKNILNYRSPGFFIFNLIDDTAFKAILGSVLFQYIVFLIILKTSDPTYWKLIMSITILLSLIDYKQLVSNLFSHHHKKDSYIQSKGNILSVKNLTKSYNLGIDKKVVFNNVNISFSTGLSLVKGSNGCGKSTFLKLLKGIISQESGEFIYMSKNLNSLSDSEKPFFYISQTPFDILAQDLSIIENLIISLSNYKYENFFISKKNALLKLFGKLNYYEITAIEDINSPFWFKSVKTLSSGQASVIAFYMSILSEKPILLYDEPTTGLDLTNLDKICYLIKKLSKEKIVIATTHDKRLDYLASQNLVIEGETIKRKYFNMKPDKIDDDKWWKPDNPNSFFPLYIDGDDSIDGFYPDKEYDQEKRTISEVDFIENLLQLSDKDLILDCPCGIGRHSIELTNRGYKVKGIDLHEKAIQMATENLLTSKYPENGCFFVADKRYLPFGNDSFTNIINMFFSFGFFDSDIENMSVLKEFSRVLTSEGKLLIHTDVNPLRIATNSFKDREERTLKDGAIVHVNETWEPESKRLYGTWRITNCSQIEREACYSVRIYSNDELEEMLKQVGFKEVKVYYKEDNIVNEINTHAREVIYIAKK